MMPAPPPLLVLFPIRLADQRWVPPAVGVAVAQRSGITTDVFANVWDRGDIHTESVAQVHGQIDRMPVAARTGPAEHRQAQCG